MSITGIILAGGKSSRMGSDKGLLTFKGKPMIQSIIDTLSALNIPIIIVANNTEYEKFGFPVFKDVIKDKGPVAGIYTGLLNSTTDMNLVLSCDVPMVSAELLNYLIDNAKMHDVTIPKVGTKIHPLIGIYNKATTNMFKSHLDKDQRKLIKVCNDLNTNILDVTDKSDFSNEIVFSNINTPQELEKLTI